MLKMVKHIKEQIVVVQYAHPLHHLCIIFQTRTQNHFNSHRVYYVSYAEMTTTHSWFRYLFVKN